MAMAVHFVRNLHELMITERASMDWSMLYKAIWKARVRVFICGKRSCEQGPRLVGAFRKVRLSSVLVKF